MSSLAIPEETTANDRLDSVERNDWTMALAILLAAAGVGFALQSYHFVPSFPSLTWLTLALVACVAGPLRTPLPMIERHGKKILLGGVVLILVVEFWLRLTSPQGNWNHIPPLHVIRLFKVSMWLAMVSAGMGIAGLSLNKWLPLLLVSQLAAGVCFITVEPKPAIDVYVVNRYACESILQGLNPYSITYPDIYGPDSPTNVPGTSVNGRINYFGYPPLSVLFSLPGHVLAGDFRFSQLGAILLSAFFIAYARPSQLSGLVAALFLLAPRTLYVLQMGWTEPFLILLLSSVVFCKCRAPRLVPFVFGLLIAIKQHLVLAIPLVVLLLSRPIRRKTLVPMLWKSGVTALAVNLPFMFWDLPGLLRSYLTVPLHHPFRPDSLSYVAAIARAGGPRLGMAIALVAAFAALVFALRRMPRTAAGFAGSVGFLYLVLFAFNNQSYCNYYYFIFGAFCCALAVIRPPEPTKIAS